MTKFDIRAELEEEQTWRRNEIRFLRNQIANMQNDSEKDLYRRSLVVMLYAHYEGFCKAALLQYIRAVNAANLRCDEVNSAIVATSWMGMFKELENSDAKSRTFKGTLPDDTQLHRFARRRHFVEEIDRFFGLPAMLSDEAVDVESNLSPIVMKKVLFRIGIDHEAFAAHDGEIHLLLNRRNNISHGVERNGIGEAAYNKLEITVFNIMESLMNLIVSSANSESFRRQ